MPMTIRGLGDKSSLMNQTQLFVTEEWKTIYNPARTATHWYHQGGENLILTGLDEIIGTKKINFNFAFIFIDECLNGSFDFCISDF